MRQVLGPGAPGKPRGVVWGGKWEGSSGWGHTCAPVGDSHLCMAKTTTICNYPPINRLFSIY